MTSHTATSLGTVLLAAGVVLSAGINEASDGGDICPWLLEVTKGASMGGRPGMPQAGRLQLRDDGTVRLPAGTLFRLTGLDGKAPPGTALMLRPDQSWQTLPFLDDLPVSGKPMILLLTDTPLQGQKDGMEVTQKTLGDAFTPKPILNLELPAPGCRVTLLPG